MSQAEDLLNSLSYDVSVASVNPSLEGHIVISDDRTVTVPENLKRIAVQYDHNVETVTFDCPRYWDDHDMSQMKIYINYMRADNEPGCYPVTYIEIDETNSSIMHFTWTITRNVTVAHGSIAFLVCVRKTDENGEEVNHWNSELNREMYVSEGLECQEVIVEQYPDVITHILTRLDNGTGGGGSVDLTNAELITLDDIDAICGSTILSGNEVLL